MGMLKAKAANEDDKTKTKKKKKGRGAIQREKKRKLREEGGGDDDNEDGADKAPERSANKEKLESQNKTDGDKGMAAKKKGIKPPKKRKVDKEEEAFESMVRSYKEAFTGGASKKKTGDQTDAAIKPRARNDIVKKRWFE